MNTSKIADDKEQKGSVQGEKKESQIKHKGRMKKMTEENRDRLLEQLGEAALDKDDLLW